MQFAYPSFKTFPSFAKVQLFQRPTDEAKQALLIIPHLHCWLVDSFCNFLLRSPIYCFGLKISNINCKTVWLMNRQSILKKAEFLRPLNFNYWGHSNGKDRSNPLESITSYVTCWRLNYTTEGKNTFSGIKNVPRLVVCLFGVICLGFFAVQGLSPKSFQLCSETLYELLSDTFTRIKYLFSTDTIIEVCIGLNALPCSHWRQLPTFQKLTLADFSSSDFKSDSLWESWQSKFFNLKACWQKFGLSTHCKKLYWCINIGIDTKWHLKEKINTK